MTLPEITHSGLNIYPHKLYFLMSTPAAIRELHSIWEESGFRNLVSARDACIF